VGKQSKGLIRRVERQQIIDPRHLLTLLFDANKLGKLREELTVIQRLHRVLILQLTDEELDEILFIDTRIRRSRRIGGIQYAANSFDRHDIPRLSIVARSPYFATVQHDPTQHKSVRFRVPYQAVDELHRFLAIGTVIAQPSHCASVRLLGKSQ